MKPQNGLKERSLKLKLSTQHMGKEINVRAVTKKQAHGFKEQTHTASTMINLTD